jgi:hypothetical protein
MRGASKHLELVVGRVSQNDLLVLICGNHLASLRVAIVEVAEFVLEHLIRD